MTINYTTLLQLPQPVDGTEAGTWGDVLNNAQAAYLDIAIAGGLAITITTTDVTLAYTQGTSSATNIGSTTSQYAILNVSGAMTAARNLIVPSTSKWYIINNACTGGYTLTIKGAATTGVGIANSEKALVAWNGSDFVKVSSSQLTGLTGTLPVANGGTGSTTLTANNVLLGNGTSALQGVAPGTSGNVLTSNGTTWASAAPAVTFPSGGIVMWSGSIASIPSGWYLCDGTNGTPNLRDKFIVGAGSTYAVAATGGSTDAIVVSHTHTASVTDPGHLHQLGYTVPVLSSGSGWGNTGGGQTTITQTASATTGISVTNSTTGSSGTNANLPPYYALAYIMKS
jgi:hypothetical protein